MAIYESSATDAGDSHTNGRRNYSNKIIKGKTLTNKNSTHEVQFILRWTSCEMHLAIWCRLCTCLAPKPVFGFRDPPNILEDMNILEDHSPSCPFPFLIHCCQKHLHVNDVTKHHMSTRSRILCLNQEKYSQPKSMTTNIATTNNECAYWKKNYLI